MAQQIQLRNDSTAAWEAENPVLAQAEIGVDTTLGKFKIGDGESTWSELQFQSASIADFVFTYDSGDTESTMSVANHDMIIRTTRSGTQDADINLESADDIFITANGDDVSISAKDEVRITSNSYDGEPGYEWKFDNNGRMTFPDGTVQSTAANGVIPPSGFLNWREGTTHLPDLNTNFGWDSDGVWFVDADGDGITSYPIFTDFTVAQNEPVIVRFDVDINDECNDIGVCVYVDGDNPEWEYGTNTTRIAAQFDCVNLALYGRTTQTISENTPIPSDGFYTVTFTYNPTAPTNKVIASFTARDSNVVIASITLNEALPAGRYRVGFAADQNSSTIKTYMSNLTIDVNNDTDFYTSNLQVGNSLLASDTDLVLPVAIKDTDGDDFITFTRTSTGTARIATPQDDLSLRSARDITLIAGDDGPGNVYIGWGDAAITPDATNRVATIADVTAATGLGDITFDGVQIIGGGTASSDGLENGTIRLVPDADLTADDQFLVIEGTQAGIPGAPGHIHLRAGGTIDESNADLILGGERNSVVVSDAEKEVKVSTAFRSKLYFTNLNSNSGTEFIVAETANILVGDTVYVGGNNESYIVDAVTFNEGLATVTANGASFGAGAQYLFTREEVYNNEWLFGSDGVFSGPFMGGVVVPGLAGTQTDDLYIQSPNDDIIIQSSGGDILLDADSGVHIGSTASPGNRITTVDDLAYKRVNVPTSSIGQLSDVAGLVADDASYHYYCTGAYDGDTHIWKRIAWSNDTWPGV